jgi:S1-C subfamily serine protease
MNERPTEPYDPADPAASTPATGTPPAAPNPVSPARISTTGGPTAESGDAESGDQVTAAWTEPAGSDVARQPAVDGAAFSPEPERIDRDRFAWETPVQTTPESWFEPASAAATATAAPRSTGGRRANGVLGPVLAASVIAATLASGGTYLTLRASGALDQAGGTSTVPSGQTTSAVQPVKIDESSAIIDVAARVSPAVVKIVSTSDPNAVDPTATEGIGSGIIYDKNGWILTNRHVVSGGGKLTVGTIYGIDTLTDLAIVKVAATDLPTAAIGDSSTLKVGQTTIAIGSPLGTYSSTVTSGILSATGRSIAVDNGRINNLLQTDTAINPGNSGGPLLDAGGNVIGINTAVATNANGIGFAIPINIARPIMEQAVAGQKLARPYIGINYVMLDLQGATELKLSVHEGAYVTNAQTTGGQSEPAVKAGSPADQAGIKDGDIIVAIEGQTIDTEHPLDSVLTQFAPGRTVTISLLRNGQPVEVKVTLGVRPAGL